MGWALSSHSIITKGQAVERVTLSEALASGDLEPFIRQAEADGLHASRADFDEGLTRLIKAPRPLGRTSRSPARDGSHGK